MHGRHSMPGRRLRWASALPALFAGVLLGFIGGYFAGGGGRPQRLRRQRQPEGRRRDGGGRPDRGAPGRGGARSGEPEAPGRPRQRPYDREDWDGAIEAYEKALRKAPNDPNLLSDLGAAYRNRGDFKQAIASFEKARAADRDHWQSLLNLVLVQCVRHARCRRPRSATSRS